MLNSASVRIVRDVCQWLSGRADHGAPDVDWLPLGRYLVRLNLLAEGSHAPFLEPAM